jgi:hypothetical protein
MAAPTTEIIYDDTITYEEAGVIYDQGGYTDLFNEALDDLANTLTTITGLRVVYDPNKINPPCVFIDAPSFDAFNYNIVTMTFSVKVITLGAADLNGLRNVLNMSASLLSKNVAVKSGRPGYLPIGGQTFAAYDLTIEMQAQTAG